MITSLALMGSLGMGLHILWNTELPVFLDQPPAISEGRLYIANTGAQGYLGNGKPDPSGGIVAGVTAMSSSTGRILWNRLFGYAALSEPVIAGDSIIVGVQDRGKTKIVSLDGANGSPKWSRPVTGTFRPIGLPGDAKLLVYQLSGAPSNSVGIVRANDGKSQWSLSAGTGSSAPDACIAEDFLVMPASGTTVEAVELHTGKVLWSAPVWARASNPSVEKTLAANGHVVAACEGNHLTLLGAADGKPISRHTVTQDIQQLALTSSGDVIGFAVGLSADKDGSLVCYRASDGSTRWSLSDTFSNFLVGREDLWVTVHDSAKPFHELLRLSPTSGKVLGRSPFDGDSVGLAEHGGHVFLTTEGRGVYCFSTG